MKNVFRILLLIALCAVLFFVVRGRASLPPYPASSVEVPEEMSPVSEPLAAENTPQPTATPVPTPEATPEPVKYTISCVGDCTLWSNSNYAHHPAGYAGVINGDYSYPFSNTVDYFSNDDLTLANLECILCDNEYLGYDYTKVYFPFIAPKEYANIIINGGVDFVTCANNHIMDCYETGANSTYDTLKEYGIPYGVEGQAQLYTTPSGLTVGIYTSGNDLAPSEKKALAAIEQLKSEGAEYIICMFHWGQELYYEVNAAQTKLAHACIDAGADFIYGSHSHCLQPVEEYNGGLIIYSMGNWTFGGNTAPTDPDTAILQLTLERDVDGSLKRTGYELIPCCVSSNIDGALTKAQNYNDYRPTPYPEDSEGYARALAKLAGEFKPDKQGADYSSWLASRSGT